MRAVLIALIFASHILITGSIRCLGQGANASLGFASAFFLADENSGSATITVTRAGNTNSAVTVDFDSVAGLATAGTDFTPQSGTLSFARGEVSKTFSIPLNDDPLAEGSETVELTLTNPTGGAVLGTQGTARLFIMDNENRGTLLDDTFHGAIRENDFVTAMALQSDGRILVGGIFAREDSPNPDRVIRLRADGSRDPTFGVLDGGPDNVVYAIAVQSDGKILIGGKFTRVGTSNRGRIARLNSDGSVDLSFDPVSGIAGNVEPGVYSIVLQRDGRVLVGGNFNSANGVTRHCLARFFANGLLDPNFNSGAGIVSNDASFQVPWVSAVALQPDGKVLIGGQFTEVDGVSRLNIARLNSDGSVDTAFDPGKGAGGNQVSVEAIALQPDGKVIIGGDFTKVNDIPRLAIARLGSNGSLDSSFDPRRGVMDVDSDGADIVGLVTGLAVQSDGKVLLSGRFRTLDDINRRGLARVNPDGSLDGTFGPYFGTTYRNEFGYEETELVQALALQPDGRVLIGATFVSANGSRTNRLTRLLSANVRSTSFEFSTPSTPAGEGVGPASVKVLRRGDSDLPFTVEYATAVGTATPGLDYTPRSGTLRFGALETEKTLTVQVFDDKSVEEDETFKLFLRNPSAGATLGTPTNHVVQIIDSKKPGNLDFGFADLTIPFPADSSVFPPVMAIAVQSDSKLLIAGHFSSVNGTNRGGLVRLNPNGSIDPGFVPQKPPGAALLDFHQMGLQPDGKIVGGFEGLYRLNPDGSADSRFVLDLGDVNALAVQKDGKFFVSDEYFDPIAGVNVNAVSHFLANGTFDPSFSPPAELDDWVNAMVAQLDGKVVVGGYFSQVNGVAQNRIARLNADGSLDTTFNPGTGVTGPRAAIYAMLLQLDGKVIIAGDFDRVNSVGRTNIARLNADGSVDPSFTPGSGPNSYVESMALQPDGKVLIGGSFDRVDGMRRLGLARLNADGSLDTAFEPKLAFSTAIGLTAIAIQPDGKIVIGGLFTAVNGVDRAGVARLNGDADFVKLDPAPRLPSGPFRITLNSRPGKQYRIEVSTDLVNWTLVITMVATGYTLEFEDPSASAPNGRFYRAVVVGP